MSKWSDLPKLYDKQAQAAPSDETAGDETAAKVLTEIGHQNGSVQAVVVCRDGRRVPVVSNLATKTTVPLTSD